MSIPLLSDPLALNINEADLCHNVGCVSPITITGGFSMGRVCYQRGYSDKFISKWCILVIFDCTRLREDEVIGKLNNFDISGIFCCKLWQGCGIDVGAEKPKCYKLPSKVVAMFYDLQ